MQYVGRGRNNVQRAPLIQLPARADMTPAHVTETMKFMAGLTLGPLSGRHSPDIAMKLSTILSNLTESARKEDPATQPSPPQAACEGR